MSRVGEGFAPAKLSESSTHLVLRFAHEQIRVDAKLTALSNIEKYPQKSAGEWTCCQPGSAAAELRLLARSEMVTQTRRGLES